MAIIFYQHAIIYWLSDKIKKASITEAFPFDRGITSLEYGYLTI